VKNDSHDEGNMGTEKLGTEIRQEQIIRTALNLIAAYGMKGLTIARIARQLGLVPSAIYRHFKGMDQILDALIDFIRNRLLKNIETVCQETGDPLERLYHLLLRHVRMVREDRAIPQLVFSEEIYGGNLERRTRLYQMIKGYLEKIEDIICQGQQEKRIRKDIDPETVSVMFLGLIQPAVIIWHVSDNRFDVTRHAEKAWQIFRQAIEAEPS
jgi:AcrR family transcriptional regulator